MNLTVGLYLKVIKHIYSSSLAGYWLHKGEDQDIYHTVLPQFYRSSLFYYLYTILLALFFPLKFEGYFWATLLLCIHLQEIPLHSLLIWPVSLQWNSVGNFFFRGILSGVNYFWNHVTSGPYLGCFPKDK